MQEPYGYDSPDALEQIFRGKINWVNLLIIAVNILVYVVMEILGDTEDAAFMLKCGVAYTPWILEGQWYRLFTSMFLHFGIEHLFNNMLLLLFLGDTLEEIVGKWKYLVIYIGGGMAGNLLSVVMDCRSGLTAVSAGASGAVFAVIGGILIILVKNGGRLQQITASRLLLMIGLSIYHGFRSVGIDNAAHIGGVLAGALLTLVSYKKPCVRNNTGADEW